MTTLNIDPDRPALTPAQSLAGWRREFCVELLGGASARIFLRDVQESSLRAHELQRGILFQSVDSRFADLAGCIQSVRADLDSLVAQARRSTPTKDNLFRTVEFDNTLWERVRHGVDCWMRRPATSVRATTLSTS